MDSTFEQLYPEGCCNQEHPLYEVGVTCLKGWVEKKVDGGAARARPLRSPLVGPFARKGHRPFAAISHVGNPRDMSTLMCHATCRARAAFTSRAGACRGAWTRVTVGRSRHVLLSTRRALERHDGGERRARLGDPGAGP
jgi:hypothetical protein